MEEAKADRTAIEEAFFGAVGQLAAECSPDSGGIQGMAIEYADTVDAVRMDSGKQIRRQCISLAAECLRKYIACWDKGEPYEDRSDLVQ